MELVINSEADCKWFYRSAHFQFVIQVTRKAQDTLQINI